VSAAPNVPRLVWPTWKLKWQADKVWVTVNAIELRRNNGVEKWWTESINGSAASLCSLTECSQMEIYFGWMVSSSL
jgi:hypothetical protein